MATSPKTATNPQHAAFPQLFKRTGEARRIKGFRASRDTFNKAMRLAKALEDSPRLRVMTPVGALVLSVEATTLLKQDGGVASLLLNGFEIVPESFMSSEIDAFLDDRGIGVYALIQGNMFNEGDE